MSGEFFTGVDAAWLRMDRPGNLAQIAGVMIIDTPIDRARLIELVHERLLVYDRFRQRVREPLLGLGLPRWEIDPQFDLNYHLPQISLPAPGGQAELQQLMKENASWDQIQARRAKHMGQSYIDTFHAKLTPVSMMIDRGMGFVVELPREADAHYAGKGVSLGAPGTPIFWYRPKDAKKYRVIYADLSVREADTYPLTR